MNSTHGRITGIIMAATFAIPAAGLAKNGGGGGTDVGGGGNAIVCFDARETAVTVRKRGGEITGDQLAGIESVEALDLHEAQLPRGFSSNPMPVVGLGANGTFTDYFDKIVKRLEITIPSLGNKLRNVRGEFKNRNVIRHNSSLQRVKDEANVSMLENGKCALATVLLQQKINGTRFLHVDDRLFYHKKHSELSRGVLLLHEIVYASARDLGQTDSRNTRIMLAALVSNSPETKLIDVINLGLALGIINENILPLFGSLSRHFAGGLEARHAYSYPMDVLAKWLAWIVPVHKRRFEYFGEFKKFERDYDFNERALSHHALNTLNELKTGDLDGAVFSDLLALMKQRSSSFYKLGKNGNDNAWKLLWNMDFYMKQRAALFKKFLIADYMKAVKPQLMKAAYLPEDIHRGFDKAVFLMIDRIHDISIASYTPEKRRNLEVMHPGMMRFAKDAHIHVWEDLREAGISEQSQLHARKMHDWLVSNLRNCMWRTASASWFNLEGVPFPAVEQE